MDDLDKKLLDILQNRFPLSRCPYREIGTELGIAEEKVLERISTLKKNGGIRRIGPVLDAEALGYVSALFALRTAPEREEATAEALNRLPGVTHNYRRSGPFNLWFTLTSKSPEEMETTLEKLKREARPEALAKFPKVKTYKLRAVFHAGD